MRLYQSNYFDNLGISYDSGSTTFTVHGFDGRALSTSNPAIIILPSVTTPGIFKRYQITANQTFGASTFTGALFGFTTSVAITVDVPFFLYAVPNDNENNVLFMISRVQHMVTSPNSSIMGTSASPSTASVQNSFCMFTNLTAGDYDENPCLCVGSFRMRMSSSDAWTVQTLIDSDGINQFQVGVEFDVPLGQFGANSGTWSIPNGGTAPVFSTYSTNTYKFIATRSNSVFHVFSMLTDGGTDGSGAVNARISSAFINTGAWSTKASGVLRIQLPASDVQGAVLPVSAANAFEFRTATAAGTTVLWSAFTNGNRALIGSYMMDIL